MYSTQDKASTTVSSFLVVAYQTYLQGYTGRLQNFMHEKAIPHYNTIAIHLIRFEITYMYSVFIIYVYLHRNLSHFPLTGCPTRQKRQPRSFLSTRFFLFLENPLSTHINIGYTIILHKKGEAHGGKMSSCRKVSLREMIMSPTSFFFFVAPHSTFLQFLICSALRRSSRRTKLKHFAISLPPLVT